MNREPINKQNLSDAVAEKLREYIRSSDAPRSLKLPPEAVIGESMGVSRITYLIDAEGKIARVWPKVSVDGHAEEVLEAAKAL